MKKILTILAILSSIVSYSFAMKAVESIKSLTPQEQEEHTSKIEGIIDQKNTELNKKISMYANLLPIVDKLKYIPKKTSFQRGDNGEYLEIEMYSFIPERFGAYKKIGQRILVVRLYYDANQELTRVQTKYTKQNFTNQQTSILILDDKNPSLTASSSHNHITFRHMKSLSGFSNKKDTVEIVNTTLGEIENTFEKPFRNNIKRTFYNIRLKKIVRNLRDTSMFNTRFGHNSSQISEEGLIKEYPKYEM